MASCTAFVYGTLLSDDVVKLLLNRTPSNAPASLHGYRRYRLRDRVYPAVVPATPSDIVQGRVLTGLSPRDMFILDEYEDTDYERQTLAPVLADGSSLDASVYIWKDRSQLDAAAEWSYDDWCRNDSEAYLEMCVGFMEDLQPTLNRMERQDDASADALSNAATAPPPIDGSH